MHIGICNGKPQGYYLCAVCRKPICMWKLSSSLHCKRIPPVCNIACFLLQLKINSHHFWLMWIQDTVIICSWHPRSSFIHFACIWVAPLDWSRIKWIKLDLVANNHNLSYWTCTCSNEVVLSCTKYRQLRISIIKTLYTKI